ncbi:MAG TPA: acyloxyacyl hydrolase [Opitutaceae bacterium]|nr:acyloxyacyl hydrolase [Opitutaceae bacterium]
MVSTPWIRCVFPGNFAVSGADLMPHFTKLAILSSFLSLAAFAAEPVPEPAAEPAPEPAWNSHSLDVETGLLWQIGTLTPISYRLVPTQLSWRSRPIFGWELADGSRIVVRHRLTLIATWVQQGPESHYIGFSGSPSVEWWDRTGTWSLFTGAGGGAGVIDSRGVFGGQGQDFTLNWFIRGGVERVISKNRRLSAGFMYQHMSNAGMSDPNPGIDALGFMIGYGWSR